MSAGEMLNLSPLCGGLPPDLAWPYLKRVAEVVLPEAAQANGAVSAGGLGECIDGADVDEGVGMTGTNAVDLYYDPFDFDIDDDPYPSWKRLRDEAPSTTTRSTTSTRSAATRMSPVSFRTGIHTGRGAGRRSTSS